LKQLGVPEGAMIYIFEACKAPFTLCGACCRQSCKCCDSICKGCSQACKEACDSLGDVCNKPMGGFVLLSALAMIGSAALSAVSLPGILEGCGVQNVKVFVMANIACAVVHCAVPFWIQHRIVAHIRDKEAKSAKAEGREPLPVSSYPAVEVTAAAKEIFKYDIVFCLYFFIFPAVFGFNLWGFFSVRSSACREDALEASGAAAVMLGYGFSAFWYYLCWICGQCCFAQGARATKKRAKGKKGGSPPEGPPPETIDAGSGAAETA